ncbi:hypothetical protein [Lignipirellula cremea]|uniref:Nickel uptake substrate-specific transmembrane region n=1 Tax=Lignipirellula cremea TaxID=2528010 RepID=A0A518DL55_9BACT|nr:hypothetical protein [Lignipirellula cremea]QDU92560.1 hypothetical protein Pla8534_03080 [Lignipirellula cremea]
MKKFTVMFSLFLALGALALSTGCTKDDPARPTADTKKAADDHGHAHGEHGHRAGPHDGVVADWGGGKFHVEFTVDHSQQEATVYILGDDEKTPAPISAEEIQLSIKDPVMQVALKASPQEGDAEGSASRFVGTNEGLGVVQEYEGTITGVVDGTPYSGDFQEEAHGDHEH